jgi:rubrerythrin
MDLAEFLLARIADEEAGAKAAGGAAWRFGAPNAEAEWNPDAEAWRTDYTGVSEAASGEVVVYDEGWPDEEQARHIAHWDPARVLAECEAKRRIVEQHTPEFATVEWPHDQTGKGEAWVCRSCGNRDIDAWLNWRPAMGEAGVLPEGVVPPYVLAPCSTLRVLAQPFADHPDYRQEWKP